MLPSYSAFPNRNNEYTVNAYHTNVHAIHTISRVETTLQAPPPPSGGSGIGSGSGTGWSRGTGFHHKSHNGKRINCLLWDDSGDRLFSVCEGGTVVLARNLRPRRGGPAAGGVGITGVVRE